ncbi:PREDICTED: probable WRKY mRNAion [Prunus dulcis]|uniref:PREDICTED: probable WRKY mRNAion n=1 Tax=Prunus dulcis TaxID=3755 RepID=A0A5E4FHN6_PRUDU|nr:probable WRKY transcription factor 46 [Prunus dulcis]KAI5345774.1 hypothetical protein L3X38_013651 [Prunus dulcis]VVA27352.1 PREDICTED: probable WRKY mRNAion [Prunus dulcis]
MEKRKNMEWEQKTLTSELTQGKELAKQLMNYLHPSASQEKRDFLISKILFSYEKALSLLKRDVGSDGESNHIPNTMLESPTSFGNGSPMSEISDQDCKNKNVFKKRKTMPRWTEEVKVFSGTGLDGSLDDGYSWRKYGQKDILGATYPRGYYRCTHRGTQGCLATKQVQKADADPSTMVVTYRGEHTCSQVLQLARSSALSLAKQASTGNQNATREAEKPKASQEMSFGFGAGLRVKTEDLDTREDDIFPSFSFPSTLIEPENVGDHIFCATLMDGYSPAFASPAATFEPDYLQAVSPCQMSSFGLGLDYVQTSESGLSEIISAPTSVTNSPIGDFGFSLDDLDFHHFENPESFAYES